jgi:hypothetical protein
VGVREKNGGIPLLSGTAILCRLRALRPGNVVSVLLLRANTPSVGSTQPFIRSSKSAPAGVKRPGPEDGHSLNRRRS